MVVQYQWSQNQYPVVYMQYQPQADWSMLLACLTSLVALGMLIGMVAGPGSHGGANMNGMPKKLVSKLAKVVRGEPVPSEEIKEFLDPDKPDARKEGSVLAVHGYRPVPGGDKYKVYLTSKALKHGIPMRDAYDRAQHAEIVAWEAMGKELPLPEETRFELDADLARQLVADGIIRKVPENEYELTHPLGSILYTLIQCGSSESADIEPPIISPQTAATFNKILLDLYFVLGESVYTYHYSIENFKRLEKVGYLARV